MASNVAKKNRRHWIKKTYSVSAASIACQKWVDDHPEAKLKDDIAAGLKNVLDRFTDSQLNRLSRHLSGNAFDVQPVEEGAADIKKTIQSLVDQALKKGYKHALFLDKEGGEIRWHAQF